MTKGQAQGGVSASGDRVALRAFREDDLPFLDRLCTDPDALGFFEWTGFMDVRWRRHRWEKDGWISPESTALAIVLRMGQEPGLAASPPATAAGWPGTASR